MARALQRITPYSRPHLMLGSVTRRKICQPTAPRLRAAVSSSGPIASITGPVMEAIGPDEETAALSLGAVGWQIFRRVTLPNIKWGLLYGVILCNARAMGEFGAVYVVSGHIAGQTDTMPLRVQKLFDEYNNPGSFAVASVLTSLALLTLLAKVSLERKTRREIVAAGALIGQTPLRTADSQETP